MRFAYITVVAVALVGAAVELWRERAGAFTVVAAVAGLTHLTALMFLRRRK